MKFKGGTILLNPIMYLTDVFHLILYFLNCSILCHNNPAEHRGNWTSMLLPCILRQGGVESLKKTVFIQM